MMVEFIGPGVATPIASEHRERSGTPRARPPALSWALAVPLPLGIAYVLDCIQGTKRQCRPSKNEYVASEAQMGRGEADVVATAVDSPLKLAGSTPYPSTSFKIALALPSCVTCAS
jgi:hypothetical protein